MRHLLLCSNHLNRRYIEEAQPDKVTVLVSKQQFEFVRFHQYRIFYHIVAATQFAQDNNIQYHWCNQWSDYFQDVSTKDTYILYQSNDFWMQEQLKEATRGLEIEFRKDINFFFTDIEDELQQPPYKLDPYYRKWRRQFDILMEDGKPVGGSFSYDAKNRGRPPKQLTLEQPFSFSMDEPSKEIYRFVQQEFPNNPQSKYPFTYPTTTSQAQQLLEHFIQYRLPYFGIYQDAMMMNEPFMVHSLISASINLGLLFATDVVTHVEQAYYDGIAPIEAVEGFIRQILGWREYIRGIYIKEMNHHYHALNTLSNTVEKPRFLYDANTSLNCLKQVIHETIDNAYNHHIQRLMIIGNIMNLMSVSPQQVRDWFNEMYVDSFDWVVTPNVIGMAMYADGGLMSTKPYISSANYINKMSNYCSSCKYNPTKKTGPNACPINALYYLFLDRHKDTLASNPRMKFMYMNYRKLPSKILDEMSEIVQSFDIE